MLHVDAWGTGLRFLPLTAAMFVAGALGGGLIGKVPFRFLLGGSTLVMAIGILCLRLTEADSSWTVLIPALVIAGLGMGAFNPARAALAIGVTEPAKSGVASGINETFQQVGIAVGIAGIGAFFQHTVTQDFTSSAAGKQLGADAAETASHGISAGGLDAVAQAAGPLREKVLAAGQDAFMNAFHGAMTLSAILGFIAAVIGFTMLRTKDLHATALSTIPGRRRGRRGASRRRVGPRGRSTGLTPEPARTGSPWRRPRDPSPLPMHRPGGHIPAPPGRFRRVRGRCAGSAQRSDQVSARRMDPVSAIPRSGDGFRCGRSNIAW